MDSANYLDEHLSDRCQLEEEFQKLATLVPTIPADANLTELEFLELVIAYIQQLQEVLSENSWDECFQQLTSTIKMPFSSSNLTQRYYSMRSDSCLLRNPLSNITLDTNRSSNN